MSPEELRGRERAALLTVQTVAVAQRMYAADNGGYFDELRCLTYPARCIPGFAPDAAPFLDPTYDWLEPRLGYARRFHPGARPAPQEIAQRSASPTSLRAYAFTVMPLRPGASGLRAFCGDSQGRLCVSEDGREPPVRNGACEPCRKLQ